MKLVILDCVFSFLIAVLVRIAADSLWRDGALEQDKKIAAQHANIIVIAILLMTTLGSGLTTILGPILLSQDTRIRDSEFHNAASKPPIHTYDVTRRKNTNTSVHFLDS